MHPAWKKYMVPTKVGRHERTEPNIPDGYEMFEGKLMKVKNGDRVGWWQFHDHYDRDGYCDNPARGY